MTTATATLSNRTLAGGRTRPSLEELVDRLMAALFREQPETATPATTRSVARSVHDARRMRKAGDLDGALAVLGGADTANAAAKEARWAYAEWMALAKRRFGDRELLVYSQGAGRAAALTSRDDGSLEVVATLGMRWQAGKVVSRRSLRGLKPLKGGESWS